MSEEPQETSENSGENSGPRHLPTGARAQRNGGFLRSGNPGNRGGGRTALRWKLSMRELVNDAAVMRELEAVLHDRNHPRWLEALKLASAYGYGQPSSKIELGHDNDVTVLNWLSGLGESMLNELQNATPEEFAKLVPRELHEAMGLSSGETARGVSAAADPLSIVMPPTAESIARMRAAVESDERGEDWTPIGKRR